MITKETQRSHMINFVNDVIIFDVVRIIVLFLVLLFIIDVYVTTGSRR